MRGASFHRAALFLATSAVLIAAAVLLGEGAERAEPNALPLPRSLPALAPPARRALASARREEARLRAAAPRFLMAFLRYEVGEARPGVRAQLRAFAAPAFARQLLARPPRATGRALPGPVQLRRIDVFFLTASARRALLSGVARRPSGPEEFSFLFARQGTRWLAIGPGQ